MNLSKLAKICGVSVSTVSKVFSESSEISEKTRQHVIATAKEYGCFEKYFKPKYKKKLIAVICPEVLGIHYSEMLTYMEEIISAAGDTMLVSVGNFSKEKQDELLEYYVNFAHADGIIVIEPTKKIHIKTDTPIVQIGMNNESSQVHCVDVNIRPAMKKAFLKLISLGHKKIGFIGEKNTDVEYLYFEQAFKGTPLLPDEKYISVNDKRFYDCGYYGMDELIKKGNVPTAVFAAYSHIAVGILKRLKEKKVKIPDDISIICMDDIVSQPYSDVELACIKMHLDMMSSEAVNLLYRMMENKYEMIKQVITVTRQFEQGKSIGEAKKS
ncbi:MAG: LacI family DNA-binding transcriptional regulator [Clostridia bacterium]|nr:LacI family DNA-binding transcriptional regulator [Clostridia bacterium]